MGVGQDSVRGQRGEQAVGLGDKGVEGIIVVELHLVGVNLAQAFANIETTIGVGADRQVVPQAVAVERLHHIQVAHIIQVHSLRHAQRVPLHGIAAVGNHIHRPNKAEVAFARRHKRKFDTPQAVNHYGVGDVIMVEGGGEDGREGADKTHRHQGDFVREDVDGGEERVEVVVEALLRQVGIHTVGAIGCGEGSETAVIVVLRLHTLVDGEMEDFGIVESSMVDIFFYKIEVFPERIILEVGVELVQTHVQLLKHPAAEHLVRHDMVLYLAVNDVLHQLHCGVVPSAVSVAFALFGGDVHRIQCGDLGLHAYLQSARGVLFQRNGLGAVSHHPEMQQGVHGCDTEVKLSVDVRHGPVFGAGDGNLDKGQRLAGALVGHRARDGRLHLPPGLAPHHHDEQHKNRSAAKRLRSVGQDFM